MIPSTSHEADRQQLRDYLLGRMPEDAAAKLDERLFEGNVLFDELENERQSLIEDFVASRLTGDEASLFQSQLSRSPELQRETDDFRRLLFVLQGDADTSADRKATTLLRSFFPLALALAILLCVVTFFYVQERRRNADLRSQLQAEQPTAQLTAQSLASGQSLVTAFLSANVPRGSSAPLEIVIPAKASTLELQIELKGPPPDTEGWKVEVLAGNEVLWQSAHTHVRHVGQEAFLTVFLNREDLPPGPYTLRYSPSTKPTAFQTRLFVIRQGS